MGQLVGQFLLDRDGIVRWTFTEVRRGRTPHVRRADAQELMSAAMRLAA